jgi:hypothetical protein
MRDPCMGQVLPWIRSERRPSLGQAGAMDDKAFWSERRTQPSKEPQSWHDEPCPSCGAAWEPGISMTHHTLTMQHRYTCRLISEGRDPFS